MGQDVYKVAFDSSPIGVFVVGETGNILEANDEINRIFGYEPSELIGMKVEDLVPCDHKARHVDLRGAFFKNPMRRKMGGDQAFPGVRKDGGAIHVEVGFEAAQLGGADVVVASVVDVSERVLMNQRLKAHQDDLEKLVAERTESYLKAKEEAEHNARVKADFLSNMSHDIRTPLNTLMGLAHLMSDTELTDEQACYVSQQSMACNLLLGIVDDILDFSRLEAGKIPINANPVSLIEILENIATNIRISFADKLVEFIIVPDPQVEQIVVDPVHLIRVLMNLLSNAAKFTHKGSVVLSVKATGGRNLRFEVRDTGIGISKDDQKRIFTPFEQATNTVEGRRRGAGLGLSICERLLSMMGSKLYLESDLGKGSCFSFDLDAQVELKPVADKKISGSHSVLIVDENLDALEATARSVEFLHCQPLTASSGDAAILRVMNLKNRQEPFPDVILLSGGLTNPDVKQVAKRIRAFLGEDCPPLCMMRLPAEKDKAKDLMVRNIISADVTKPILPNSLQRLAAKFERKTCADMLPEKRVEVPSPAATSIKEVKLLLVDDNEVNLVIASAIMAKAGAHVTSALSGAQALQELESASARGFDIILLDLHMPGMDGYETCRRIRNDLKLTSIPILAFTAGVLEEQKQAAFDAGMNGFIRKPFNVAKAVALIAELTLWSKEDRAGGKQINIA